MFSNRAKILTCVTPYQEVLSFAVQPSEESEIFHRQRDGVVFGSQDGDIPPSTDRCNPKLEVVYSSRYDLESQVKPD
jgi:hypothetical protein